MAAGKTIARLISIGSETRDVSINFEIQGINLPEGKSITVIKNGLSKELILTRDSFEDDPPGNLLRLNNRDIALFGFRLNERITVQFDTKANTMTLRSVGAK